MFKIAAPQSVTLVVPGDDGPFTTVSFSVDPADAARCHMDVVTPDGCTHRATFNTAGSLCDVQYIEPEEATYDEPASVEGSDVANLKGADDGKEVQSDEGQDHPAEAGGEKQPA